MTMYHCYHCGDQHHVNDFCASGPMAVDPALPASWGGADGHDVSILSPGGWLIKADGGKWEWTGVRLAAVAALTEGRRVYDVTKGRMV